MRALAAIRRAAWDRGRFPPQHRWRCECRRGSDNRIHRVRPRHERLLVPLEEELAVVRAYLDIESLRLGDRLKVEQTIDLGLLKVLMPPFSFQPLVENAVQHGLQSSPRAGRLQLAVRPTGPWLEMSVSDDGQGLPSTEVEPVFLWGAAAGPRAVPVTPAAA